MPTEVWRLVFYPKSRTALAESGNGLHEPFLQRAADSGAEPASSHALAAFLTMRLVDQFATDRPSPPEDALAYQVRATRDFIKGLQSPSVESNHLYEIVRVAAGIGAFRKARLLWPPLLAFAYWLEQELRLEEALDVLRTGLCLGTDGATESEIAAHLQLGRVFRLAGRFEQAHDSYAAASRLAARAGDGHSVLLSRIGRGLVAQQVGNLPEAERLIHGVLDEAKRTGDRDAEARACHDLAVTHAFMGREASAVEHSFQAFKLYEQRPQRTRALGDTGIMLKELGHYSAAKRALLHCVELEPPPELRVRALVELMELGAYMQDRLAFERWRRELAERYEQLPPDEQVEYEIKLGYGLAMFDRGPEGVKHLEQAVALAEQYGLGERLFRAESLLKEVRDDEERALAAPPAETEPAPELRPTIEALEALAATGRGGPQKEQD